MAIRIRKIGGHSIAFCAAEIMPHKDDLYLDDDVHHALTVKFEEDFVKMGMFRCEHGCIRGRVFHSVSGIPAANMNWTPCPKHSHLIEPKDNTVLVAPPQNNP